MFIQLFDAQWNTSQDVTLINIINHCIDTAINLVVCIIPCVDTSMCVSIVSPVFSVTRLFALSASST